MTATEREDARTADETKCYTCGRVGKKCRTCNRKACSVHRNGEQCKVCRPST